MASEIVATARRSSLVSTFGVGSLLPAQDDSVMICSIDDWPLGDELVEPRLAQSLGVGTFRSPSTRRSRGDVPAVRFPVWAFCPECRTLGPWWDIARQLATGRRVCKSCSVVVSPSRFVCCCTNGHIDDFPYRAWAHEDPTVPANAHQLRLITRGHSSALSDLIVQCSCGASRSLDGAFEANALRGIRRCSGSRPWLLNADPVACDESLRTLQRGSSNVWFAAVRSAISIPSVKARARLFAERKFRDAAPGRSAADLAADFVPPPGCSVEDVAAAIEEMRNPAASSVRLSDAELRAQEYRALVNGLAEEGAEGTGAAGKQFLCIEQDLAGSGLPEIVTQVSRVSRLREVRALYGFSRITPASSDDQVIPVSEADPTWLPAIEVMGEGVFVRFDEDRLSEF
ncbi:MAG TPA: DrmB family protein, partial [Microlunatus sp.]